MALQLTTVTDDSAVLFDGAEVVRCDDLDPDTEYEHEGVRFRTLVRPPGERLALVATVNDVHFGETVCGMVAGRPDIGPVLTVGQGESPYPETMNGAAVAEIAAREPDAVVVKGDLTSEGTEDQYAAFLACYGGAFGDRLHHVRGNHDAYEGQAFADHAPFVVTLPGVSLAVLDTVTPRAAHGRIVDGQLEWLEDVAGRADRPVLVFGHHHLWDVQLGKREGPHFGINPDDSESLVEIFARRSSLMGYFAGHTHRNRVRRFRRTGDVPWVEVACVKDFPGAWAEYRVFEGGVLQAVHRIADPAALSWSERTRAMYNGQYEQYAFGRLDDRCFPIWPR